MGWMKDETGLDKTPANYVPLTPLSHLRRAADVFAQTTAVIYGDHKVTYAQYHARCSQLASALKGIGVQSGDVVATLLPNTPAQCEAAFGVPACGAVLNTINTRLDPDTVAYIFDHGEAKAALVDTQFMPLALQAIERMDGPAPILIEVPDAVAGITATGAHQTYEDFLATGDAAFAWMMPEDEWESLALNYTSGTTGRPKGRGLSSPRRVSDDHGHTGCVANAAAPAVPDDCADVSL
jgi:fatty-acyl-CoA synthase